MMTASPNRRYFGHHKATEKEGDQGILEKEIWRKKCGQQDTSTAGGRWRRQHKTSGLWTMFHRERQGISQVKSRNISRLIYLAYLFTARI